MADRDNRLSGATRLSLPVNRSNGLGKKDLDDLFSFSLGAKSKLDLGVSNLKRGANFDVELYKLREAFSRKAGTTEFRKLRGSDRNRYLTLVGASRRGRNASEAINLAELDSGSYFLRILRKSGDSKYRLTATATTILQPGNPDPSNPNPNNPDPNTPSQPVLGNSFTNPYLDFTVPGTAASRTVSDADKEDYYQITPSTSGDYLVDLSGTPGDVNLAVFGSNATTVLKQAANAGNEKFILPLNAGTNYYFRVSQAALGNTTSYSLGVTKLSDNYSGRYVNSTATNATPLTLTSTSQTVSNYAVAAGVDSPEDLFSFSVTPAQAFVRLELTNMPLGDLGLQIFKSDETPAQGLTLARGRNLDGSYPSEVVGGRLEQGTYYVRVIPGGAGEGSTYDLALSLSDKTGIPAISRDIKFGTDSSSPQNITSVGGFVYFSAEDQDGTALWRSDGTLDGTKKIRSFNSLNNFAAVGTGVNARLYFAADDGTTGQEVWTTDGITASKVIDLNSLTDGSSPEQMTAVGNNLYFIATTGATDKAIYQVAGNSITMIARENAAIANPDGTASSAIVISDLRNLTGIDNTLYFSGDTTSGGNSTGNELFSFANGATAPTFIDLKPGGGGSSPNNFIKVGNQVFLTASAGTSASTRLVRLNPGVGAGYSIVRTSTGDSLAFTSGAKLEYTVTDNGTLYFAGRTIAEGTELFKLDNAAAAVATGEFIDGSALVKDVVPGVANSSPTNLVHVGNKVFYFVNDNVTDPNTSTTTGTGKEVWITDGTSVNTRVVADVQAGIASSIADSAEMVVFQDKVYFTANDGTEGTEIWEINSISDGNSNPGNRRIVINTTPGAGASPEGLTVVGNTLFFSAINGSNGIDSSNGQELWSI